MPITRVVTSTITPAPLLVASAIQASCGNTLAIVSVTPSGSAANPSSLTWSPTPLSINSSTTIGQYQIPTGQNTMVVTVVNLLVVLVTPPSWRAASHRGTSRLSSFSSFSSNGIL